MGLNLTVSDRLQKLEANLTELGKFRSEWTSDQIAGDTSKQWAIRYGIFESIQIVIDCACHIVSERNLGNPNTYLDCLKLIHKFHYINNELLQSLKPIVGLRNILIHEYIDIELDQLISDLTDLSPFHQFIFQIQNSC